MATVGHRYAELSHLVPDASLKQEFASLKVADPDPKVVVKGADDVDYQSMIKVLDALQQLDITKVGLATQQQ